MKITGSGSLNRPESSGGGEGMTADTEHGGERTVKREKKRRSAPGAGASPGFSLVEILIAMVVFTVGIIAIMYLFPFGVKDISRAKELTAATFLGQAKLEEALVIQYDPMDLPSPVEGEFSSDYPALFYRMECTKFQNKLSLVHISVEVYKTASPGGRKTLVQLDSLKSSGGCRENN